MIGDIVGRPGRTMLKAQGKRIREEYGVDFFIANAENSAGGSGITPETAGELLEAGIDVLTTGDHVFKQKTAIKALENRRVIRPLNYPPGTPGTGWTVIPARNGVPVAVVNLAGRVFMNPLDCPFRAVEEILEDVRATTPVIVVDMHAEATSEKIAMGWFLNGRVSAVCGTHTHVQTADARILSNGTAYITDVGMTGAHESVLGREIEPVLAHFRTGMPHRFAVAGKDVRMMGVCIDIDEKTGTALAIKLVQHQFEPET